MLATSPRGLENQASSELFGVISSLGDSPMVDRAEPAGVLLVESHLPAARIVEEIRRILADEPWRIRFLKRLVPLEVSADDVDSLLVLLLPGLGKISKDESFRVTVDKRFSELSTTQMIERIASKVDAKVSLDNPDWIIQVEVVGKRIYASVLRPKEILSVVKEKRGF